MSGMAKRLPAKQQAAARNVFQNMQTYRNNSDSLEAARKPTMPGTKSDSAMEATCNLCEAMHRLQSINRELKSYVAVFLDSTSSQRTLQDYTRRITHCIIPALSKIASIIENSGKHIAPIAGAKIACDRIERAALKDAVDPTNKRKSVDYQILEMYAMKSSMALNPEQNKRCRSSRQSKVQENHLEITLPIPQNGTCYTKFEALEFIESKYPEHNLKGRSKAIDEMIRQKYIPCKRTAMYDMLKKRKEGRIVLNNEWSNGRPRIVDDKDIHQIVSNMHNSCGRAYGKEDINNIIVDHQKKKILEANRKPLCFQDEVNKNTLSNYVAQIALHGNISINQKVLPKTNTRITAENSSRGSICNVFSRSYHSFC